MYAIPMTPEDEPRRPADEARIAEEEEQAAREAGRIGGDVSPEDEDPARKPLAEAGEGEAEGFELAEKELEESASHGDSRGFPEEDVPAPEERSDAEYGEPDEPIPSDSSQLPADREK